METGFPFNEVSLALADLCSPWSALQPPNRIRISEGAAKSFMIKRPGGGSGLWNPRETPYMIKPMDTLASRRHSAVCFVGPAQTGKTAALVDGWLVHAVINDPGDMLIVQMTQDKSREFSKQRLDRAIKNSPDLWAMRSVQARDDNLHDKQFKNGMWVRVAWPTATNFASTSYRYVAGTDYDRWNQGKEDVDGEGDGFGLMGKRITTFLSRGMVMVESSPGRPRLDPTWVKPIGTHEAPPVGDDETGGGILGVYNRGDRQRWMWPCPHCREWFEAEPGLGLFRLPSDDELLEDIRNIDVDKFARQHARVPCPHCGAIIKPAAKDRMNQAGIWIEEGLSIDDLGRISGTARTSSIASFWLGGVAATYVSWETLIRKQLQGLLDFSMTGGELALQTTANTDQGIPYLSRRLAAAAAKNSTERFDTAVRRFIVPDEARFLVASVDVQGGKNARFSVQVHAIGPHQEQWLVDRYDIRESKREGMGQQFAPIDPARYAEDWNVLTERVVQSTYRTSDPDREMRIKLTVVDTGGEGEMSDKDAGVTNHSYAWYRRLRKAGLHKKVCLYKGRGGLLDWFIKETMVGGAQGKGDVPLLMVATNRVKDIVDANLQRATPGPGYYHFPPPKDPVHNPEGWLPKSFFDELKAEVRGDNGVWEQIKTRNETFDHCVMIRAGCLFLKVDKRTFWDSPPAWALPFALNSDSVVKEVRQVEQAVRQERVAPPAPPPGPQAQTASQGRQVRRSSYLGG